MPKITITVKDSTGKLTTSTVDFTVTTTNPTTPSGLTPPDGGRVDPYKTKLTADPNFFPIGVWFESVLEQTDIVKDKATGLNTYVVLTGNSSLALLKSNDMHFMAQQEEWTSKVSDTNASAIKSWFLWDEIDMQMDPGPARTQLQNIVNALPKDGRLRQNNYGKGIMFWYSLADAQSIVRNYTDVTGADIYWFTDPFCLGQWEGGNLFNGGTRALTTREGRRASNYGATVNRMRTLQVANADGSRSQPVWNIVELGGPFTENTVDNYIKPREVQAAVWHSLIAGARGIVYFNHTFGGANQTQHILRANGYENIRAAVTTTNLQVKQIAHVLNGSFAAFPTAPTGNVKASLRYSHVNNKYYVIAGHADGRGGSATTAEFTVPVQSGTVTVEFENRTIPIVNGKFSDSFADVLTTHVYRIN